MATVCFSAVLALSASLLLYVYGGYGLLLGLLSGWRRTVDRPNDKALPKVTVLLTVHNEADKVAHRLRNLLDQDYPVALLDIIVASDGSTDDTESIVQGVAISSPVKLIRTERLGKSGAQNAAMGEAQGDIVIFTDADARFAPDFVRRIAAAFADPAVGGATGHLRFTDPANTIGDSQGLYWRYELLLRRLESAMGILAVASGAAMAVRRSLFRPLPLHVGEDCVIPLDVVRQGFRFVHVVEALAFDQAPTTIGGELKARVRMTMRNWTGTWMYPELLDPFRHPGYALALWSHKLLRWTGSFALAAFLMSATILTALQGWIFPDIVGLGVLGGLMLLSGIGVRIPLVGSVFSFLLANLGFLIGTWKGLRGRKATTYSAA